MGREIRRRKPIRTTSHIFRDVFHLARCQRQSKVKKALIAETICSVKRRARRCSFLVATVTVHGTRQIDSPLYTVFYQGVHNTCNTLSRQL